MHLEAATLGEAERYISVKGNCFSATFSDGCCASAPASEVIGESIHSSVEEGERGSMQLCTHILGYAVPPLSLYWPLL